MACAAPPVRAAVSLSPRAGRGWGEGALPRVRAWRKYSLPSGEAPSSRPSPRTRGEGGASGARSLHTVMCGLCGSADRKLESIMAGETKALAQFAAGLRYEDIPAPAVAIAKACIVDTVGVVLFGSTMPWSRIV